MSSVNVPPILEHDNGNRYIRVTPKGDFLQVPDYGDFWNLVHHTGYVQLCHHMDNLNQTQYIGPQNMIVVWNSLCLYHYQNWNDGSKTDKQKLAHFDAALLMPTDPVIVDRLQGYWEAKKAHFGIREELADSIDLDQLHDLQRAGLTTDDPSARKDKRKLIIPECASWDDEKKIGEDDISAEELEAMMAEDKEAGDHDAIASEADPMDMSGY